MLSTFDARNQLLSSVHSVGVERITIHQALDRVLAQDLIAPDPSPRFDNSSMDGFAVHSQDIKGATKNTPVELRVAKNIPAGSNTTIFIKSNETARIMTGAPMPHGADAVLPVEDTDQDFSNGGELPEMIRAFRPLDAGAYVRVQGEDFAAGQALFSKGSVVSPQVLGLIAHLGYQEIQVHRRLRVAVFSSGNELVQPGQPIAEGQIRDTNTFTISALLESMHVEVIPLGIAKDDLEDVQDRLDQALRHNVDLIISTAGVSVGVYDFVRTAVEQHGQIDAWRVNMRPGKPLAFGSYKETPFVGLPGNPVSSFVGFEVFIRPLIQHMAGNQRWRRLELTAVLAEDIHSDGRESYLRARLGRHENGPVATLTGHQGSGNLYSLSLADALIIIPAGVEFLKKGSQVQAWPLT